MGEVCLSTSGIKRTERAAHWAELVSRTFVELECEVPAPDAFHGKIDCFNAGESQFFHISSSPHVVTRTRSRIEQSSQSDFLFALQISGRGTINQGGRQASLEVGDFAIFDTTRPYDLRFDDDFSQIVMRFPRRLLADRIVDVEQLTARTISGERGTGKLVSMFVRQLHAEYEAIGPISLIRMHASVVDLIATALGEQIRPSSCKSEYHNLLRSRVSAYIDRNLADMDLSCDTIAAAHGISSRQLSKVFEHSEVRVSQLIWAKRLDQARRHLADPLLAHVSVTGISYDVGFKDVAHFSRSFKAVFGATPTEFRARAHGLFESMPHH